MIKFYATGRPLWCSIRERLISHDQGLLRPQLHYAASAHRKALLTCSGAYEAVKLCDGVDLPVYRWEALLLEVVIGLREVPAPKEALCSTEHHL